MKDLLLLVLATLLTVNMTALATPTPSRPIPPRPTSTFVHPNIPPNPSAVITYADGGGTVKVSVDGEYYRVVNECRGLEGSRGITFVDVLTKYDQDPYKDRRAYRLHFFPEFGCKFTPGSTYGYNETAETSYYDGQGKPLKNFKGEPMIPKSFTFKPKYIFPDLPDRD